MFKEYLRLHEWIKRPYPDATNDVLDPILRDEVGLKKEDSSSHIIGQLVVKIFNVGLQCLKQSPDERTDMKDVVVNLKKINAELIADHAT
ncbi:hypothetical protein Leryth_015160 [Lithospermum erythrorhizon]|nr:hypothetical protein Leryth_015160 [Lithospermum erythrorhizon]